MPKQLALFTCILFILWLFARDRKLRPMTSWALWLVLLWIMIIGSRPVSLWLNTENKVVMSDLYIEGSPLDRNVFILIIVMGLVVLSRRKVNLSSIFAANRWLFVFLIYCGISVIWADYPYVSFKRWVKDIGNVVMLLIIFTEKDPVWATKAVFIRYSYLAIPLSVTLIKYFPEYGRYYNRWTWEPVYSGVTTEKNALGCLVFISFLFLLWDYIEMRVAENKKTDSQDLFGRIVLLVMIIWLLVQAGSMTSLLSMIFGSAILLFLRRPHAMRYIRNLGAYSLMFFALVVILYSVPDIFEIFVGMLGRNVTLTGRTDLWADLLREPINPLLGTGYQSFWLGRSVEQLWEKYAFHPNQAHNGYLETYLNGGVIGLFLLITMILSTWKKLRNEMLVGSQFAIIRFSFLVVNVFYNWTEAMFNRMSLVWVVLLIAALDYKHSTSYIHENITESAKGDLLRSFSKR